MFDRILILVILCVYCDGSDPQFRYDYKYNKEANGWLKLHYAPLQWDYARLQCYYEGAVLASPLDVKLVVGISKYLSGLKSCPDVMFSGVSDMFSKGAYASVEGVPLERMPIYWSLNEPAHSDGCLVFYSNGTMGSKSCRDSYPFICYKEYQPIVLNDCGTVDNEYQLFNKTNLSCYKYHSEWENWATAYKICMAEGGYLAITADYKNEFQRKQEMDIVAIGYKTFDGTWWDIHGKKMVPNSFGANSMSCGGRNRDGQFTRILCDDFHPFICEKTVDSLLPSNEVDSTTLQ